MKSKPSRYTLESTSELTWPRIGNLYHDSCIFQQPWYSQLPTKFSFPAWRWNDTSNICSQWSMSMVNFPCVCRSVLTGWNGCSFCCPVKAKDLLSLKVLKGTGLPSGPYFWGVVMISKFGTKPWKPIYKPVRYCSTEQGDCCLEVTFYFNSVRQDLELSHSGQGSHTAYSHPGRLYSPSILGRFL